MASSSPLFLCIDGGGTKTRAVISTSRLPFASATLPPDDSTNGHSSTSKEVEILSTSLAGGSNLAEINLVACVKQLLISVERAIASLPLSYHPSSTTLPIKTIVRDPDAAEICPIRFQSIWIGLSGADNQSDADALTPPLTEYFQTVPLIQNDALLLSSPLVRRLAPSGILAVCGTGSVVIAVRAASSQSPSLFPPSSSPSSSSYQTPAPSSRPNTPAIKGAQQIVSRRGGLGFLLGDEGSAYHIGRTLLRLVLYSNDAGQLKGEEPFLKELLAYWRARNVGELLGMVYEIPKFVDANEAQSSRKLRIAESTRLILAHAIPAPDAPYPPSPIALQAVHLSAHALAQDISLLLLPMNPSGIDPSESMLALGGSLAGQPSYRNLLLKTLKDDFGIVFGLGWDWVEDAAVEGARVLAGQ